MAWQRWSGVAAGAALLVAAPVVAAWLDLVLGVACALAAITVLLLAWPSGAHRVAGPWREVASWQALARGLGLPGLACAADGRAFLGARKDAAPPLDDGRSVYDGLDGHPAGLAFWNPMAGPLEAWLRQDPDRLASLASADDDLDALAQWSGWFRQPRVLAEGAALRVRWSAAEAPGAAVAWLVLAALARAAGRTAIAREHDEGSLLVAWGSP